MMQKAVASGVTLIEGFMLRHHPLYRHFAALVQSGETGAIDTVRASFQEFDDESETPDSAGLHWRRQAATGGGVAFDGTCYPLHVCSHLANSLPLRVAFDGTTSRYGTLSRQHGYIRYENGVTGLIQSSLRAVVGREAEVSGTKASLYLPIAFGFNIPEGVAIRRRTGRANLSMRDEILPWPKGDGPHEDRLAPRLQLENFADVTRGRATARVPLAASVVNAFTLDAMVRSAQHGCVVDVQLPQDVRDAWHVAAADPA
jgi:predicted dehydrogenase